MTAGKEPIAVSELPTDVALKPFTRYVHGPASDRDAPLFPRDGSSQGLRVVVDIGSLPEEALHDHDFIDTLRRGEIETNVCWLSHEADQVQPWRDAVGDTSSSEIVFRDVTSAKQPFDDTAAFWIKTSYPKDSSKLESGSRAHFFPAFIDCDEHFHPASDISRSDRERLAVMVATTRALKGHLLVTGIQGAGRVEVSDNDSLAICDRDNAMAVIGHYLRSIESRIYRSTNNGRSKELLGSLKDFYSTCVEVNVPVAHVLNLAAALHLRDQRVVTGTYMVIARLERALRAVDDLLRSMTRVVGNKLDVDTSVELSEAFDRELISISAALDLCGRMLRDRLNVGGGTRHSLQSVATFEKIINPYYATAPELPRLQELQPMFRFAHELRNSIHDSILEPAEVRIRQYGSAKAVALVLDEPPYQVGHAHELGIWQGPTGSGAACADLPTLSTGLLRNAMEYVNTFLLMVAIRKPSGAPDAAFSLGAGSIGSESMPIHRIPHLIGRLFGWNVPQPFPRHVV
jgi:hypothetical protein